MFNKKDQWARCSLIVDQFSTHTNLLQSDRSTRTIASLKNVHSLQFIFSKSDDKLINQSPLLSSLLKQSESLQQSNRQFEYVYLQKCPIHLLLLPSFVQYFVRTGQIYAQSVESNIQDESAITFGPDGVLHLSIDEQTYQSFGLVGTQSAQYCKQNIIPKRTIRIDLNHANYASFSSRTYQRTFTALRNSHIKLNVTLKWEPPSDSELAHNSLFKFFQLIKQENTCESNLGEFLDATTDREQLQVHLCAPSVRRYPVYSVKVPTSSPSSLTSSEVDSEDSSEFMNSDTFQLIETVGGILAGIDFEPNEDVSQWPSTETQSEYQDFVCYEVIGHFNDLIVADVLSEMKRLLDDCEEAIDQFVLITNGFENAVVAWYEKNSEHGKQLSGECLYGMLARKDNDSILWQQADSLSFGIEKL